MMAARTKEEERLLDEKIARIQRKNEEILRREKEIEEDKRLAAKQNAIVQLRSTSSNDNRERTPALKPSKREFGNKSSFEADDSAEIYPNYSENITPRGRGGRRGRDRSDRNDDGPPPDPRSYLADFERDPHPPSRDVKREDFRSNRGAKGVERGSSSGGREFQRGGRRGRGRPERGRGRDEEAWRAERNRIDEERIQRQKSSDGSWRREWDSEKIEQELDQDRHIGGRGGSNLRFDRWKANYSQRSNPHTSEFEFDNRPSRGFRGARPSRGRLDNYNQHYVDRPISPTSREDYHHNYVGKSPQSPRHNVGKTSVFPQHTEEEPILIRRIPNSLALEKTHFKEEVGIVRTIDNGTPKTILKYPANQERSVIDVGNSFKISVPNTDVNPNSVPAVTKTPRRPNSDMRPRHKSQTSYSSQSEDEAHLSPKERGYHGGRNKRHAANTVFNKNTSSHNIKPAESKKLDALNTSDLPASYKPPLPPFRSSQAVSETDNQEFEDGEESWEDVTTSGTESIGEEISAHSSPNKELNAFVVNTRTNENIAMDDIYTPEDFLIMQKYENYPNLEESSEFYSQEVNNKVVVNSTKDIDSNINSSNDEFAAKIDSELAEGLKIKDSDQNTEQMVEDQECNKEEVYKNDSDKEKVDLEKPILSNNEISKDVIKEVEDSTNLVIENNGKQHELKSDEISVKQSSDSDKLQVEPEVKPAVEGNNVIE